MIHFIPLENLEERYTILMNNIVNSSGLVTSYYPKGWVEKKINKGEFLDIERTIEFKAKQLSMISKAFQRNEIKSGDWIFFADIFFPGIDAVKYMSELQGINIKVAAFNHAGRADETDFVQRLGKWSDKVEEGYHRLCDLVFVGSEFHKKRVSSYFSYNQNRIKVTGCVWNNKKAFQTYPFLDRKEDIVIFPHRLAAEKGLTEFYEICWSMPDKKFIVTSSSNKECRAPLPDNVRYINNLTKREYYQWLSKSKYYLSTAYQETFGYTLREALLYNCRVVVPNDVCYPEMLPKECLFERRDMETIKKYLSDDYIIDEKYKFKYDNSFKEMIDIINNFVI